MYGNFSDKRKEVVRRMSQAVSQVYRVVIGAVINPSLQQDLVHEAAGEEGGEGGGGGGGNIQPARVSAPGGWGGGGEEGELPDVLFLLVMVMEEMEKMDGRYRRLVEMPCVLLRLGATRRLLRLVMQMPYLQVPHGRQLSGFCVGSRALSAPSSSRVLG